MLSRQNPTKNNAGRRSLPTFNCNQFKKIKEDFTVPFWSRTFHGSSKRRTVSSKENKLPVSEAISVCHKYVIVLCPIATEITSGNYQGLVTVDGVTIEQAVTNCDYYEVLIPTGGNYVTTTDDLLVKAMHGITALVILRKQKILLRYLYLKSWLHFNFMSSSNRRRKHINDHIEWLLFFRCRKDTNRIPCSTHFGKTDGNFKFENIHVYRKRSYAGSKKEKKNLHKIMTT